MIERVLKLDIGGRPIAWITREEGALLYCRDQVAWEAGVEEIVLRGGFSRVTGDALGPAYQLDRCNQQRSTRPWTCCTFSAGTDQRSACSPRQATCACTAVRHCRLAC